MDGLTTYFGLVAIALLVSASVTAAIGYAIGKGKGRGEAGGWLGFFFSVLGIIIVAVMEPSEEVRRQRLIEQRRAHKSRSNSRNQIDPLTDKENEIKKTTRRDLALTYPLIWRSLDPDHKQLVEELIAVGEERMKLGLTPFPTEIAP